MTWYESWMKERMTKGAEANREFYAAPSTKAIAPFRIADDLYYVGDKKVCAHLIRTEEGLILIDAGYPEAKHLLWESIIRLGFDPADVRWIILTHGHSDHYGAANEFRNLYGTKVAITGFDWLGLILICFVLPAIFSWVFCEVLRKKGWIRENDLKLDP